MWIQFPRSWVPRALFPHCFFVPVTLSLASGLFFLIRSHWRASRSLVAGGVRHRPFFQPERFLLFFLTKSRPFFFILVVCLSSPLEREPYPSAPLSFFSSARYFRSPSEVVPFLTAFFCGGMPQRHSAGGFGPHLQFLRRRNFRGYGACRLDADCGATFFSVNV